MRRWRRALGVGTLAALAVAIAVMPAAAKRPRVKASVTIDEALEPKTGYHVFSGEVSSRKAKCERRRLVTLYFESEFGAGPLGEPVRTDAEGRWEIRILGDSFSGEAHVTVKRKSKKRLVCKRTESERITVG